MTIGAATPAPSATTVPKRGAGDELPTVANGGVSADDVAFTFSLMADPKSAASTSVAAEGVKSVTAKDTTTVVVTYAAPNPNSDQWGVGTCCYILQKKQFESYQGERLKDAPGNLEPIGTGPYLVDTFKPGDVVTYKMNDQYRDPNKPYFKTVTFKGGGDAPSVARAILQTGNVDCAWNLQVEAGTLKAMVDTSTKGSCSRRMARTSNAS